MLLEVFITLFVVVIIQIMVVLVVVQWDVDMAVNSRVEYGVPSIEIEVF